jgi:hypothetical protein
VEVSTILLLALAGCGGQSADHASQSSPQGTVQQAKAQGHSDGPVRVQMKGVDLVVDPPVVLEVRSLRGEFVPTKEGEPPRFDEPGSFTVRIDQGEVAMTAAGMSAVMNRYVFSYPGAPVKDIEIKIEGDHIKQTATVKKKVDLKTTIEGKLSVTPEGDIRLHPDKIKAEGLPVKGLLDLFDVELDEMIKARESRGVRIEENDFILDPEKLLPPPRITGRVTAVRIEGDLSVTPEGDIRLHPTKIKADGLPVKGLLDLFDVELSEMIKSQESKGVRIVENDFILDPEKLGPSPRMLGRVVAVRLEKDHLVQIFGGAKATPLKPSFPNAAHYIFFRGGELSFGKLTMHGADLQIIDKDPKDALLMSPNHFDRQLVAGFSRTLPDKGLAAFVPDYNEIGN